MFIARPLLLARFSCLVALLAGLSFAKESDTFSEYDLDALLIRLQRLEASAEHPLFARHLRSLGALAESEWARAKLYPADSKLAALVRTDLTEIAHGLDAGNDRWEAFRDAGQPLVIARLSKRDQTLQIYHLVLPRDWDESHSYPLFLELHAYGGEEMRPLSWVAITLGAAPDFETKHAAKHMHAMVARDGFHVLPYGRGNSNYVDIGEIDIWEALDDAEATLKVDPTRRYLYGFSMGGAGTYLLAAKRPELWAAVAILGGSPGLGRAPDDFAQKLTDVPVFLWSGEKDPWIDHARHKAELLRSTGSAPRAISFAPDVSHDYLAEVQQQAHAFLLNHSRREAAPGLSSIK